MSRYILNSTTFTKLDDPPGIVENISGYRVEIYYNPTDTTGVILYPYQSMPYTTPIWARRELGEAGTAVVATIPYNCSGGSGNVPGSYYLDYDDDYCVGGNNNVNICVTTHTGNGNGGCCCCDTDTTTIIQPATVPSCCCNTDTGLITLPAGICDCNNNNLAVTLPSSGGNYKKSASRGDVNIQMPIVINIPNYFPPPYSGNITTPQVTPTVASSDDDLSDIDEFFDDKEKDDDNNDSLGGA